jgi:hypothetical protein
MDKPSPKTPWLTRLLVRVAESLMGTTERIAMGGPVMGEKSKPDENEKDKEK